MPTRLLAAVCLALAMLLPAGIASAGDRLFGRPAPDFTLKATTGEAVTLSDVVQKGPVVLHFWSDPTILPLGGFDVEDGIGRLGRLVEGLSAPVEVYIVVQDPEHDRFRALLREQDVDFPVLVDPTGHVASGYAGTGWPTTVVVDRAMRLRASGMERSRSLHHAIEEALAGKTVEEVIDGERRFVAGFVGAPLLEHAPASPHSYALVLATRDGSAVVRERHDGSTEIVREAGTVVVPRRAVPDALRGHRPVLMRWDTEGGLRVAGMIPPREPDMRSAALFYDPLTGKSSVSRIPTARTDDLAEPELGRAQLAVPVDLDGDGVDALAVVFQNDTSLWVFEDREWSSLEFLNVQWLRDVLVGDVRGDGASETVGRTHWQLSVQNSDATESTTLPIPIPADDAAIVPGEDGANDTILVGGEHTDSYRLARVAHDGRPLWRRDFPLNALETESRLVASPDGAHAAIFSSVSASEPPEGEEPERWLLRHVLRMIDTGTGETLGVAVVPESAQPHWEPRQGRGGYDLFFTGASRLYRVDLEPITAQGD